MEIKRVCALYFSATGNTEKTVAAFAETLAEQLGVRFADAGRWDIPLAYDGVHFTEQGHKAFATKLLEELK